MKYPKTIVARHGADSEVLWVGDFQTPRIMDRRKPDLVPLSIGMVHGFQPSRGPAPVIGARPRARRSGLRPAGDHEPDVVLCPLKAGIGARALVALARLFGILVRPSRRGAAE